MTQNTADEDDTLHPVDILINVIVTLLAPMFIAGTGGNIHHARIAALDTVKSYCAQNQASLMAVAKIIGFGLATLGSLSLSMADDLSIPMILRLRGNANALDRSSDRNERALKAWQALPAAEAPANGFDEAAVRASVAEAVRRSAEFHAPPPQQPPAPRAEPVPPPREQPAAETHPFRAQWAAAMAQVAQEELAEAANPNLPPDQRRVATARAALLSNNANALLSGKTVERPRPGDLDWAKRPPPG
nr:hypothetical protein [uncultured Rhodopila sp.]